MSFSYHIFAAPDQTVDTFLNKFEKDLKKSRPKNYSAGDVCCSVARVGLTALAGLGLFASARGYKNAQDYPTETSGIDLVWSIVGMGVTSGIILSVICCCLLNRRNQNQLNYQIEDDILINDLPLHIQQDVKEFVEERGIVSRIYTIRDLRSYCLDQKTSESESLQIQIRQ